MPQNQGRFAAWAQLFGNLQQQRGRIPLCLLLTALSVGQVLHRLSKQLLTHLQALAREQSTVSSSNEEEHLSFAPLLCPPPLVLLQQQVIQSAIKTSLSADTWQRCSQQQLRQQGRPAAAAKRGWSPCSPPKRRLPPALPRRHQQGETGSGCWTGCGGWPKVAALSPCLSCALPTLCLLPFWMTCRLPTYPTLTSPR